MSEALPIENREMRTPAAFLPYQQKWSADESPVKWVEKSRRVGLSWGEAGEDALLAASEHGMDVFYIGYNKDMALEYIEDAAGWARHYSLAASSIEEFVFEDGSEKKGILAFRLRFASGFKIVALSSRPANLRGKQGKIVIDEAAFHDDLKGLLKAAVAMLMWGGRVVVISTHNGEDNPFNEGINDIRAGRKPYSLHRITLDDALKQGLYKRICLRTCHKWTPAGEKQWRQELIDFYGDDADEELFCIPSQGEGTYLSRVLIEQCTSKDIPVLRYQQKDTFAELPDRQRWAEVNDWCEEVLRPHLDRLPKRGVSFFGEDFARNVNLTIMLPFLEQQNTTLRAPFHVELWNMPFQQQEQVLYYICDHLPGFSGGALDARGNGQYLAERAMQRYGANRILQVMLTEPWYRENMPRYRARFEDREILLARDADVIADHRAIKKIRGVARIPESQKDEKVSGSKSKKKRHGDTAIAGALGVFAAHELEGFTGIPEVTTRPQGLPRDSAVSMGNRFAERPDYRAY